MTFLATWGCASDFLKMLPKFKMSARGQLQNFLCAQKNFKVLLKFKMAATDQLQFLWAQKLKKLVWSFFFANRFGACSNDAIMCSRTSFRAYQFCSSRSYLY